MPERAALVTGGSSGIGLAAIAEALGEEGFGLAVAARRPEKLGAVQALRDKGFEVEEVAANLKGDPVTNICASKRSHLRSCSMYI